MKATMTSISVMPESERFASIRFRTLAPARPRRRAHLTSDVDFWSVNMTLKGRVFGTDDCS